MVEVQIQVDLRVANYDERLRWSVVGAFNMVQSEMAKEDVLMVLPRTGFLHTNQKWQFSHIN